MKRNDWEFEYYASDLATAAEKRRDYRAGRLKFWEDQKVAVMAEIREAGIEVSESPAPSHSNRTGMGPRVMVRNDLQERLTECHEKIREHDAAMREYEGWRQVLDAQHAGCRLQLHHNDWLYFFGE